MKLFVGLICCLSLFSGCTTIKAGQNFVHKIGFLALQKKDFHKLTPAGEVESEVCHKQWLDGVGSAPTFEEAKAKLVEDGIVFLKNAQSSEYAESGFLGPVLCIALSGEGYR